MIATKVFNPMGDDPNQRGLSRKHIHHAIDASLRRLGTDYVDLYQIHRFDYDTPIEETLRALDDIVRAGKALYIGGSSMYAYQFAKMLAASDANGLARFVTMQNHYNLVYREEEREMLPLCREEGIGVIPWSPLARGFLAGNRRAQDFGETTRAKTDDYAQKMYYQPSDFAVVDRVTAIAQQRGIPNGAGGAGLGPATARRNRAHYRRQQNEASRRCDCRPGREARSRGVEGARRAIPAAPRAGAFVMLRTVNATRYVTPFREGGSLPALVEADDLGLYVLKFHGAGQGPLALAAEIIAGEIGRALGLKVPELVLMEVDAALGRNEPDYEIRELLRASTGLNMALDFLPGSVMFDPAAGDRAGEDLAPPPSGSTPS